MTTTAHPRKYRVRVDRRTLCITRHYCYALRIAADMAQAFGVERVDLERMAAECREGSR